MRANICMYRHLRGVSLPGSLLPDLVVLSLPLWKKSHSSLNFSLPYLLCLFSWLVRFFCQFVLVIITMSIRLHQWFSTRGNFAPTLRGHWASLVAQLVKNATMWETWVRDLGSIPGLGRFPGEGKGYPLQYSCLENPMDRGAWWAIIHGVAKSQTWLSDFTHSLCVRDSTLAPQGTQSEYIQSFSQWIYNQKG